MRLTDAPAELIQIENVDDHVHDRGDYKIIHSLLFFWIFLNETNLFSVSIACRSHSRQYEQNSLLNMTSSTPTPSEILIPDLYLSDQVALASATDIECEIASRSLRKNSTLMQSNYN